MRILNKLMVLPFAIISLNACAVQSKTPSDHIQVQGVDHVGLTVKDLDTTSRFFVEALGYKKVKENADYPSFFVTDGKVMVTLWQVKDPVQAMNFDRKNNIGLHHLAFKLNTFAELDAMHEKLKSWPDVKIEFAPEFVGAGPAKHFIFSEPGGVRLEFIVQP